MHVSRIQVDGTSLVGLYILPLRDVVLIGKDLPESTMEIVKEIFNLPVIQTTIAGTPLLGVFIATDGEKLIVPHIIFDHERKALEKAGIDFEVIESIITCHGNNLVVTKQGLLANHEYELEAIKKIELFFGKKAVPFDSEETTNIGSFLAHNNTHGLVSHDFSEKTIQSISDVLGLVLTTGTVNMGSTQIKSGIAVNDTGFIIGEHSGGPEVINADEALGFTDKDDH
ncbi:MAG: hypothetical protein ACOCU6_01035 [Nanoarchaeota archaeon]